MKTESEVLFERYCYVRGIKVDGIAVGKDRTPDYRIEVDGIVAFVEIKQFDPNKDELAALDALPEGEVLVLDSEPGGKARAKIASAAKQLSGAAKGMCPAIVVLNNNLPFLLGNPASPYNIRVAMYGFESVVLQKTADGFSLAITDLKFGPKKRLTETQGTTISAIAVLSDSDRGPYLSIYHNEHAAQPLPRGLFRVKGDREFVLTTKVLGKFQEWQELL